MVSDGGVHSGFGHLEALIRMGAEFDAEDLVIRAFTDGRDTLPRGGAAFLETVEVLALLGEEQPPELTGRALLAH